MKANNLLVSLLFCLLCTLLSNAQWGSSVPSGEKQMSIPRTTIALQLTMKIVGEAYCKGDSELDGLRLDVLFNYTNVGNQPLILYKGSNLVSRTMVSRNPVDAAAKRFELNSSLTQLTAGGSECFKGLVPNKCFVILTPDSSYEVKGVVGIFAVRDDARRIEGAISSGEHVLQVEVPTWPESNELAIKFRSLWQPSGCLWYEPLTSSPMSFTVAKQRKIVDCP